MKTNNSKSRKIDFSIVAYFVNEIFELNQLPKDVFHYMCQNVLVPLSPVLQWDLSTCNNLVEVEEDKVTLHFKGKGSWEHSVLANLPNIPKFGVLISRSNSMAIGYAPRNGFDINGPTMYTKGLYLYTGNSLYHGGVKCKVASAINCSGRAFSYNPDTLITVYLDTEKKTIGFKHNDEDYGVCYSEIDMTEDLYPAVSCVGTATIKIISAEHL